jgi:hypothetical protein
LFHTLTDAERQRLCDLAKDIRTVQEVTSAFGEPDIRQPVGWVSTTPERDGKPETTKSYPVMIYSKLSEVADVHVTIYPTDRVGFSFQGKAVKKHEGKPATRPTTAFDCNRSAMAGFAAAHELGSLASFAYTT